MNLTIDERTKHRLTGLVVIMAVAIIFIPAMLKKSNKHLEENIHIAVQLPPKPSLPKVAVTEEKAVFETIKVSKVALPTTVEPVPISKIARVDNFNVKPLQKIKKETLKPESAKAYAVQLAVFNHQKNAKKLVTELRKQGYKARYLTINSDTGKPFYKVTVGQLDDRADATILKNKLIESTNLKAFIVKHEMG